MNENEPVRSAMMEAAFNDESENRNMRLSLCIALYAALAMLWFPSLGFSSNDIYADQKEDKPVKRVFLKPPPEKLLERPVTQDRKQRKAPMPDTTPDDPEPVVEPDPPEAPDMIDPDTPWEIGIPEGPPQPAGDITYSEHTAGLESPIITKRVQPEYPARAVRVRMQGYVIVRAIMRKDGTIDDIKVVRGLGKGKFGFEEAAAKALSQWEFIPGRLNEKGVDVQMTLRIDFRLG